MIIRRKQIEALTAKLLQSCEVVAPPVPVKRIAKRNSIVVKEHVIPNSDISGILLQQPKKTVVLINSRDLTTRKRFTIAHEIGHTLLHRPTTGELHVDRGFDVRFRNQRSKLGTDAEEREANLFAAELLMPRAFIDRDIHTIKGVDLEDGALVQSLADKYQVSSQAMLIRLSYLGYTTM